MTVSEQLRAAALARGVTVYEISKVTRIPWSTLRGWLARERRLPEQHGDALATYLGARLIVDPPETSGRG